MYYAIKAPLAAALPRKITFRAQKSMYGGRRIQSGDVVFLFQGVPDAQRGLRARGVVADVNAIPRRTGVLRETPRVTVVVTEVSAVRQALARDAVRSFVAWGDGRPQTELNFKLYRQATNKVVGLSDATGRFLARRFATRG